MAGTPLAEAFVRVRAITSGFKDDVRKGFDGLGRQAGDDFGRDFAKRFTDAASPAFQNVGKQASEGLGQASDATRKFELQLAQAELAARRLGLAAREAADRAKAASDRAAEAAEQVKNGELGKEEAARLAARAAVEQEKAEIAATNAQLAKVKVSEKAAQVSQAYAKAQADASQETDRLSNSVRSRLNPDLDRSHSVMSGLLGASKSLSGAFAGIASSLTTVGAGAAAFTTLAAGAASSAGFVTVLAAELAPLSGLLAALPGLVLTGAVAMTTWKLATYGVGQAMHALWAGDAKMLEEALAKLTGSARDFVTEFQQNALPALKDFQATAQQNFFAQLSGSLAHFSGLIGGLKPAVGELAAEFGRLVREFLGVATAERTIFQLNTVFGNTRTLVSAVRDALQPLLTGFLDLGTVGSSWLASLSGGLTETLTKFGQWMTRVAESGQAWQWMDGALAVLKQLGAVAKDAGDIVSGIFKAARDAGTGALGVLGQIVDKFAQWVNSTEGQEVLVTVFKALDEVGRALVPVLSALGKAVALIAPEAAKVATALGPVLADAIRALGGGIAALGPGLVTMVEGFGRMVTAIGPLEPLGAAIGEIFAALGDALALVIPQVAQIALALAPALAAALRALGPALAALGPGLVAIAQYLAKAFADPALQAGLLAIGKGISDVLIAAAPLLPVIAQLAGILAQALGGALSNLGVLLGPIIAALASALEPALHAISDALTMLLPLMPPIYKAFGDIGAALIAQLLPPLINLIPVLINSLIPAFAEMAREIQPLIPLLADLAVLFISDVLPAILPILPELTKLSLEIAKVGLVLAQLVADVAPFIERIIQIFQHLYDTLVGHSIIPDLINGMVKWFRDGIQWVKDVVGWFAQLPGLISNWLGGVVTQAQAKWNEIRNAIAAKIDEVRNKISDVLGSISARWNDAWNNVRNFVATKWDEIRNAVSGKIEEVLGVIRGIPGRITGALGNLGGLLYNSGRSIIQGLIDGLYSMLQNAYNAAADILGRIRSLFPFSPAKEGPFSGKGWTLFSGQSMMAGLAKGVLGQEGALTSALGQVLAAGQATLGPGLQMPVLAAMAGPTPAPDFTSSFGTPTAISAGAGAGQASRSLTVQNLNVTLQGVLDPSNPVSYRRTVEQLREAIRELEKEAYANG